MPISYVNDLLPRIERLKKLQQSFDPAHSGEIKQLKDELSVMQGQYVQDEKKAKLAKMANMSPDEAAAFQQQSSMPAASEAASGGGSGIMGAIAEKMGPGVNRVGDIISGTYQGLKQGKGLSEAEEAAEMEADRKFNKR